MTNPATLERPVSIFEGPYRLSIAGKLVGAKNSFDVFNPATGKVPGESPFGKPRAVQRGRRRRQDRIRELVRPRL